MFVTRETSHLLMWPYFSCRSRIEAPQLHSLVDVSITPKLLVVEVWAEHCALEVRSKPKHSSSNKSGRGEPPLSRNSPSPPSPSPQHPQQQAYRPSQPPLTSRMAQLVVFWGVFLMNSFESLAGPKVGGYFGCVRSILRDRRVGNIICTCHGRV